MGKRPHHPLRPKHLEQNLSLYLQVFPQHLGPKKAYKVLSRWYMTLNTFPKFVPAASPKCFQGCREPDALFHIWWSCPKAIRFWMRVYTLIRSVLKVSLACNPLEALLHKPNLTSSAAQRKLVAFVFPAVQLTLPRDNGFSTLLRFSKAYLGPREAYFHTRGLSC